MRSSLGLAASLSASPCCALVRHAVTAPWPCWPSEHLATLQLSTPQPGKVLHLHLNTSVSVTTKDKPVLVQLAYLRSYKHMGWAEVT